ncbi:hypothetical protein MBLNU230_g5885t1 [Neophaeotheca triangularis]
MSPGLKTPDADSNGSSFDIRDFAGAGTKEHDYLREFTRSPHPYARQGKEIEQHSQGNANYTDTNLERSSTKTTTSHERGRQDSAASVEEDDDEYSREWRDRDRQTSTTTTTSESGTEADDERPHFVKALPPAQQRPRKGLKGGEQSEDGDTPLLTPSQLDDEGRRLSQSEQYFRRRLSAVKNEQLIDEEEKQKRAAQDRLQRRRLAEFVRRSSECALVGVIAVCVLCGHGVWEQAWAGRRELLSHVGVIAALILAYPVKLSIVDSSTSYSKPWQRFRVPASFDPATVLYPTFLPVLVALSISPASPEVLLPNVILALASLPQRLFPRSSRLAGINVLHWFVSILPLIAAENTAWPSKSAPGKPYSLRVQGSALEPETLASLYALHHALMVPLHFLTTTSLLASELHLLSAVLINLLFFAASPQASILSSCLWLGGILLFVLCARVLHWNVTLARVPKWKLRRPGHVDGERKSLVDAASELINVQRSLSALRSNTKAEDSDADEDQPAAPLKATSTDRPKLRLGMTFDGSATPQGNFPKSAVEPLSPTSNGFVFEKPNFSRQRRNTQPARHPPDLRERQSSSRRRGRYSNLLWCLQLTPAQAQRRKYLYAAFTYFTVLATILGPIRWQVGKTALQGNEPIGWALGYLLGQLPFLRPWISYLHLTDWIRLPPDPASLETLLTSLTLPPNIPHLRLLLGAANLRLLLIAYWILILLLGLLAVFTLTAYVEVDTRRKVFHGVMVAMLLPATFVDPCFCSLALSLIAAVFLIFEVIRAGQVPPLGNAISRFVAPYVDGRDLRGPVVVSHIFLLIGCAVPLWFSLATTHREGSTGWEGWDVYEARRDVGMIAGVTCVGLGDAAASLIGRRYGRRKWMWIGGKSLEGSAAMVVAVTAGLMAAKVWMAFGGWPHSAGGQREGFGEVGPWVVSLLKAVFCGCGASFMEAVLTGANDNVVVPVALWLLVKGVRL